MAQSPLLEHINGYKFAVHAQNSAAIAYEHGASDLAAPLCPSVLKGVNLSLTSFNETLMASVCR